MSSTPKVPVEVVGWVEGSPTTARGVEMMATLCKHHADAVYTLPSATGYGRRYVDVCDFCEKEAIAAA